MYNRISDIYLIFMLTTGYVRFLVLDQKPVQRALGHWDTPAIISEYYLTQYP